MAEYSAVAAQVVATNQNVLFTEEPVRGGDCTMHREGSGIITLRGLVRNRGCNCNSKARYKVSFGANIAIPTGGTAGPISLALAIGGEALPATQMIVTPAAVNEFFNVSRSAYIDIPAGCCQEISVKNTSGTNITVQNANIIVERVA